MWTTALKIKMINGLLGTNVSFGVWSTLHCTVLVTIDKDDQLSVTMARTNSSDRSIKQINSTFSVIHRLFSFDVG